MPIEDQDNIDDLTQSLLWPLNLFCAQYGREMPEITPLFGQHMPEPYKSLLVHDRNMTPTLEAYHHGTIHIEPINVLTSDEETTREVILRRDGDNKALEYGASRVFRSALSPEALFLIDDGRLPLGTILRVCECEHKVQPSGFFKIRPTAFFISELKAADAPNLYGRRNTLVAMDGTPIAEVCEILPPENTRPRKRGKR
jgi:chorismate-pyruvate lyase